MSLSYIFRESFSGFRKVKVSGIITIFTITVSLLLLGIFLLVLGNINDIVQNIRDRIEIEVFLKDHLTASEKDTLNKQITGITGVSTIKFISKDEASKIFRQEFGEDINKVLDFNPLPESYKITLNDEYKNSENVQQITKKLKDLDGIDDVIYRKTLLELLDRRARLFSEISLIIGVVIGLISMFLISNTIRLVIYSKRKMIETMKLVGATGTYIKAPFIIEGLFHGFLAGIIASIILYLVIRFALPLVGEDLFSKIVIRYYFFPGIIFLGCLLSFIGSIFSTKLFISRGKRL
jgi:cell division transport system permease protein